MTRPGHRALRIGRASMPHHAYLLTVTTCGRCRVFLDSLAAHAACRRFECASLLGDARMLAWVLMHDHVHWLVQLGERKPLHKVVEGLKAGSAREVNRALGRTGPLWSRAYHDHGVRMDEDIRALARYVIANPIRAGLARRAGDYPYWNACFL